MRGRSSRQPSMLCLVSPESRVPNDHPLREIKRLADTALKKLSRVFNAMYAEAGRPSVPPERLLKSQLLIALYSIRSERQFCEQLEYNLLFRWFVDMDMLEEAFDASTFSRNRDRLMEHEVAALFFAAIRDQGSELMSHDHFSADGTLLEAWASMKSFRPKDDDDTDNNGWGDFRGQRRSNETHESKTDPEAKLMRKGNGREAKLCYAAHALMENRNGLLVDLAVSEANGTCERETAAALLEEHAPAGATVGADRAYDTRGFVARCRDANVTPHVAQFENERRSSAIDGRTTRHPGYGVSQRIRMRIEQIFGWLKTIGGLRRTRFKGRSRTQLAAYMIGAAYNLLRIAKLHRYAA
ncbi:MAG TPA: IS5 family transposase [Polyangiaceae bacterium]